MDDKQGEIYAFEGYSSEYAHTILQSVRSEVTVGSRGTDKKKSFFTSGKILPCTHTMRNFGLELIDAHVTVGSNNCGSTLTMLLLHAIGT